MTDNAIVQWDPNSGAALPAYLSDAMGELGSNIQDRMTVPSLSYEGKNWTIVKDGNKTKLQAQNSDGDMVPVPIMRCIILNYNPDRGRAYYPGVYNPAESKQPDCWSADGKTPDASCKNKQSTACNGCPMSVKGSKVQDGKEMVACSSHRMIAVAPAYEIESDPLRLKIAVTSDYDKEVVEHGWFAFRQYTDFLKSRSIQHTGMVVTKIKFDPNTAYPKLLFSIDRLLSQDEVTQVKRALANPKVTELLSENWSAAGAKGTATDDKDIRPAGLEAAYADGWVSHPDAAGYSYKGQEVVANEELAARYPAPEPEAPATPPPAPASEQVIENPPQKSAEPAAPPSVPKPTDPAHIAHAGTSNELWWNGTEWVTPWEPAAPAAAEPTPPPAPPAPEPTPAVEHDPHAAALADGWVQHPESEPHGYKGQEVLDWATIHAKYPAGNAATSDTPLAAPAGTEPSSGQTATSTASPSSGEELTPEVKALLGKWS